MFQKSILSLPENGLENFTLKKKSDEIKTFVFQFKLLFFIINQYYFLDNLLKMISFTFIYSYSP